MVNDGEIEKGHLGLAGEYAVASELCRRGVWAQVTMGNYKMVDLLVEGKIRTVTIQVKSKQRKYWPRVQGRPGHGHFIVLVDFNGKLGNQPDFYILNHSDWCKLVKKESERFPGIKVDDDCQVMHRDGWEGLNVNAAMVRAYKDKWKKITHRANGSPT